MKAAAAGTAAASSLCVCYVNGGIKGSTISISIIHRALISSGNGNQ